MHPPVPNPSTSPDGARFSAPQVNTSTASVGREAALQAIQARPGQWELAISRRNTAAQAFWRRIAATVAPEVEELDLDDERWNGLLLRFVVPRLLRIV